MARPQHLGIVALLLEETRIDPVRYVDDAIVGNPGLPEVWPESLGDDHDPLRAPVEETLDPKKWPQEERAPQRTEFDGGFRPDVSQLEDERHPEESTQDPGRGRGEELGRRPHHHIGTGRVDTAQHDGREEE